MPYDAPPTKTSYSWGDEAMTVPSSRDLPPAFVLGMDANGLGVARDLGRAGVRVVGVDDRPFSPGLRSRFVEPVLTPDRTAHAEEVVKKLLEKSKDFPDKGVLFPTADSYLELLCAHWGELSSAFHLPAPEPSIIQKLLNKRLQYEAAAKAGVPLPVTFFPGDEGEAESMADRLTFPVLLKPYYSHAWQSPGGKKAIMVQDKADLISVLRIEGGKGTEVMVQDFITGPDDEIVSVAGYASRSGLISPLVAWRKERQFPLDFGVGCFVRTIRDDEAMELTERLVRAIGYIGIFEAEFKRDARDQQMKLIEINARSWLQSSLGERSGVDLVKVAYMDALGRLVEEPSFFHEGVRWWDAYSDLQSYWELRGQGRITTGRWIRSWLGSETFAYLAWDDPIPALARWRNGLELPRLLVRLLRTGR